jgi:ABC-type nickel/cobalt efflux system permease component RcnA
MRAPPLAARLRPLAAAGLLGIGLAAIALAWAATAASDGWLPFIVEMQRELHRRLADALAAVRAQGPGAAWPLVGLAFAYGVFHAAGPGHGKVVIATYLTTHEGRLAHGLALTVAAALAQAATAIVAVHALAVALDLGLRATRDGVARLEPVSFALVALLGIYLALRAARRLARGHDHGAAHACATCTAADAGAGGPWSALGVVAAIGARPCAGAVVVLLLAYAGGLPLVGIAATLAMAVGTAVTTSALAVLAVGARRTAARVADRLPGGHGRLARLADGAALAGGLGLVAVGGLLLHAALTVPAHPFR